VRHAKRTDANHQAIRDGLRDLGYDVLDLSDVGGGVPDICCRRPDHSTPVFLEIKQSVGKKEPKAKPLTKEQELWKKYCGSITYVVTSLEEALEALKEKT